MFGLPFDTRETDLVDHFSLVGAIQSVQMSPTYNMATICYEKLNHATAAVKSPTLQSFKGVTLTIAFESSSIPTRPLNTSESYSCPGWVGPFKPVY